GRLIERRRPPGGGLRMKNRRRPTLPGPRGPSTIGAEGLNCSVRNGKRCGPLAITTEKRRDQALSDLENCTAWPPQGKPYGRKDQKYPSSPRTISTGLLNTLLCLHIRP